jgi:hypothetical protein
MHLRYTQYNQRMRSRQMMQMVYANTFTLVKMLLICILLCSVWSFVEYFNVN